MVLDLCMESVGAVLHVLDSAFVGTSVLTRRNQSPQTLVEPPLGAAHRLDDQVRNAAQLLPFSQTRALWLVDTCGSTYAGAAVACGITETDFADQVRAGRRAIRDQLRETTVAAVPGI